MGYDVNTNRKVNSIVTRIEEIHGNTDRTLTTMPLVHELSFV